MKIGFDSKLTVLDDYDRSQIYLRFYVSEAKVFLSGTHLRQT